MKISVTELRKMIKEATMGEEQFAELEAAREFDKRARKEGAGSDFKYNFDENGMSFDYQNLCTEKKEKKTSYIIITILVCSYFD